MSLNLLLGYTGPAQPRPRRLLRHRRLHLEPGLARLRGAPAARRAGDAGRRSPSGSACCAASCWPALCGWVIGRISFKVRGAYFVIVTVSFAEVVRLVALNWVELTQGPMALNNIPLAAARRARLVRDLASCASPPTTTSCWWSRVLCYVLIRRLVQLARRPRHDRAARERAARHLGRRRRHALSWCSPPWSRPAWPARPARSTPTTCASSIRTCSCSSTP